MAKRGVKKSRGESPKQRWTAGATFGLGADEYAVMLFLERAYTAGQDRVAFDAIYTELRLHAVTASRIAAAVSSLCRRSYVTYRKKVGFVELVRCMKSKEMPPRDVVMTDGTVRFVRCPPAASVGHGWGVPEFELVRRSRSIV